MIKFYILNLTHKIYELTPAHFSSFISHSLSLLLTALACSLKTFFFFLAAPCGMWDLSSRLRIEPVPPALEAQSLNHWTAREVPESF